MHFLHCREPLFDSPAARVLARLDRHFDRLLAFVEDVELTNVNLSNYYKLNKKKNFLEVNANASVVNVHNFLLKEGYFAPYFPSYPLVTIGACIANGSHGISPKNGLFNEGAIFESLMSIKRSGASAIVTYFALDIAKKLK